MSSNHLCNHPGNIDRVPRWRRLMRSLKRAEDRALAAGYSMTPQIRALSDAMSRLSKRRRYVWSCSVCRRDLHAHLEDLRRTPEEREARRGQARTIIFKMMLRWRREDLVRLLQTYVNMHTKD